MGLSQPGVDEFSELEVPGPDAGLEEEGVGGEIWVGAAVGHEIEGGYCFAEMAHIDLGDQTVMERLKVWILMVSERRR